MLSCDYTYDEDTWFAEAADEFAPLDTARLRKCLSCKKTIAVGETCLRFRAYRYPRSDYEERRFGDEVPMAARYLCENCGEIWFNLEAAGFCLTLGHDLRDDLRDYWDLTGFDPKNYEAKHEMPEMRRPQRPAGGDNYP